ncbi:MAG: cytochrome c biogenesis protein CcsA [Ignavibacteria bacterium]|nr:cytochrome c biogenesis protein CcsA [Ignavibacteria bacterium]
MGPILIHIAFAACIISSLFYWISATGRKNMLKISRPAYIVMAVFTISSASFLLYNILTHQFQYTYIWNHSSTKEPLNLLIATFYAGQEGSFHLWALWMSIIGIFLMSYTSKHERYEAEVMGTFTLLQAFILFILIVKSPYTYVWESFAGDVAEGFIPPEGRGLNPLLQNFWMTIHPPILFVGFSAMSVPFCFAVAALIKNKYDRWVNIALPWTLFAAGVLGLGIMLGGYWAYGVLGWGGYWAWDPVENSSLVPWITSIAAIHLMISSRVTKGFIKSTLFLCIISYVLVLYSTFLTRSGVLGDASVHSFVDPGQEVYLFLIIFLSLFAVVGIGLIIFRFKSINSEISSLKQESSPILSRESALFIGAITLCASALVVLAGTSWPIFAKGSVEADFYNKMNLPIAILISFINGASILLKWKHTEEKNFMKSLVVPFVLASVLTGLFAFMGMRDFLIALLALSALFAFFINAETAYVISRRSKIKTGAYLAHIGFAVLLLGVIGSSRYSQEENLSLPIGQTVEALGYRMTYLGATPIPDDPEKYHFNVKVERDGKEMMLKPVMYYSDYSEGVMKNPDIVNLIVRDLYLSPMALEVPEEFSAEDVDSIVKGSVKNIKGLDIHFVNFNMDEFKRDELSSGAAQTIGADLEINENGVRTPVTVKIRYSGDGVPEFIPVKYKDNIELYLVKISVSQEPQIQLAVVDRTRKMNSPDAITSETLILTASVKPLINLVWGGTVIIVIGFALSVINRVKKSKAAASDEEV